MKVLAVAWAFVWLCLVAVGCNSDGVDVPEAGTPPLDGAAACQPGPAPDLAGPCAPATDLGPPPADEGIEQACARLAIARSDWEAHFTPPTIVHKVAATTASCIGVVNLPGSLITAADIEACVATIVPGCGYINHFYPACLGYGWDLLQSRRFKGAMPSGSACHAHLQCQSGYCRQAFGDTCGTCITERALGEPCGEFDECDLHTSRCVAGVCTRAGAHEGDPCIDFTGHECDPDLYCSNGKCTRHVARGGACDRSLACEANLYCRAGVCTPPLQNGAPCPDPQLDRCVEACIDGVCHPFLHDIPECGDCSVGTCVAGLDCGDDHTCTRRHWPGLGEPCGDVCAGVLQCAPDSWTTPTGKYCVVPPALGEPCTTYGGCALPYLCDGFAPMRNRRGTCVRPGAVGERCPCEDELRCLSGVCRAYDNAPACR